MSEVPTKIVVGYADRLSVAPGETISFMVNVEGEARYRADIVKLISGDWHPRGAGFKEELIATTANGDYPGRRQDIQPGSFAIVDDDPRLAVDSFSLQAVIWPTTPLKGRQTILAKWSVAVRFCPDDRRGGALALTIGMVCAPPGLQWPGASRARMVLRWCELRCGRSRRATLFREPLARCLPRMPG